jgi:ribosomal protein S18 acetylase RimI-like enzyme
MLLGPVIDRDASALVLDGEAVVGFVLVERDPTAADTWFDLYVDPPRADLSAALIAYAARVAQEHRDASGQVEWHLRSGSYATDEPLTGALQTAGLERIRRFWRMRVVLTDVDLAGAADLPEGVEVLSAYADPVRRAAYEVQTVSFEDHWNHVERPYDEWVDYLASGFDDPDGWWLLTVEGVPAAVCLLDDSRAEMSEGYIRSLGVLRDFRGRGLATLLLRRAFAYYRDRGRQAVSLGVDSDSPTGANHLYEKVGMRPHRVIDAWSLPID